MNLHPTGLFKAKVLDHGMSQSKKGQPVAWAKFETQHGIIHGFFYLTDKAAEHSLKKIAALGYFRSLSDFNDGSCIGNECEITVDHEDYEGAKRAKVGWVNPIGGGPPIMSKDKVASCNAKRFDALLAKIVKDQGATKLAPRREPGEDEPDAFDGPPPGCEDLQF